MEKIVYVDGVSYTQDTLALTMLWIFHISRADLEGAHRARASPKMISNTIFYYNIVYRMGKD